MIHVIHRVRCPRRWRVYFALFDVRSARICFTFDVIRVLEANVYVLGLLKLSTLPATCVVCSNCRSKLEALLWSHACSEIGFCREVLRVSAFLFICLKFASHCYFIVCQCAPLCLLLSVPASGSKLWHHDSSETEVDSSLNWMRCACASQARIAGYDEQVSVFVSSGYPELFVYYFISHVMMFALRVRILIRVQRMCNN